MGRAILWATVALLVAVGTGLAAMLVPAPYNGPVGMAGVLMAWLPMYRALMAANGVRR